MVGAAAVIQIEMKTGLEKNRIPLQTTFLSSRRKARATRTILYDSAAKVRRAIDATSVQTRGSSPMYCAKRCLAGRRHAYFFFCRYSRKIIIYSSGLINRLGDYYSIIFETVHIFDIWWSAKRRRHVFALEVTFKMHSHILRKYIMVSHNLPVLINYSVKYKRVYTCDVLRY